MKRNDYFMVAFLSLVSATPPIATDIYLPAIPKIALQYGEPESLVSLSLILWFVAFSISLLFTGPLSDKYGRKPVLLTGLLMFIGASVLCATSDNSFSLICARIIQGIGAGAPSSVAMAITKDKYSGTMRQMILAYMGLIIALAPMLAPSIGAIILRFSDWHTIFLFQAIMGIISFAVSLIFKETNLEKSDLSIFKTFLRYIPLMKNRGYMKMNTTMGLMNAPFFAFIALSPMAYLNYFHVSSTLYGLLFGFNAFISMTGAYVFSKLAMRVKDYKILHFSIIGCVLAGLGLLLFGSYSFIYLTFFMAIFSFFMGMSRPISNSLILDQVDKDVGTASSFIVFYQFMMGGLAMMFVTQAWSNPVKVFGGMTFILSAFIMFIWVWSILPILKPAKA